MLFDGILSRFGRLSMLVLCIGVVLNPQGELLARDSSVNYRMRFSSAYHYEAGNTYFFAVEYYVFRKRRPLWFIMPIERPPRVFFHKVYLYSFNANSGELVQHTVLRDEIGTHLNLHSGRFIRSGDRLVFAHQSGMIELGEYQYDLFFIDLGTGNVRPVAGQAAVSEKSELYKRYFGDFSGPPSKAPGMVSLTELRRQILADVPEEAWGLPRDW